MKIEIATFTIFLAIVAGCENINLDISSEFNISAKIEATGTKATLTYGGSTSDNFLTWETGDKILLVNNGSRVEATLTSGAGTKNGTFTSASLPAGDYYAIYPASEKNYIGDDDSLFVDFPNHLTYNSVSGNVENGGNVMIAQQSGTSISFKNICSYLRFTITGEESQRVSKVELEAIGSDFIAGQLFIDDLEIDDFSYENDDKAYKSLDIAFPAGGVALSETGLSFNVAVAPECENGFKATVYLTDSSSKTLTSSTKFGRNKLIVMPAFEFTAE